MKNYPKIFLAVFGFLFGFIQEISSQTTWSNDIAPIIYEKCAHCHHQGAIAPFELMSYPDVFNKGSLINHVLNEGSMPPWPPDPNYRHFANEFYLTNSEITFYVRGI